MSLRRFSRVAVNVEANKDGAETFDTHMSDGLRELLTIPVDSPMFRTRNANRSRAQNQKPAKRGSVLDYMKRSSGVPQITSIDGTSFDLKDVMYLKGSYRKVSTTSFKFAISLDVTVNGTSRMLSVMMSVTNTSSNIFTANVVARESLMKQFKFNAAAKTWFESKSPPKTDDADLVKLDAKQLYAAVVDALVLYYQ